MLKKRGAGVLLHISSMPSEYGVGVFDENVIHFIDKIADMGFTYWQVLPFNPLDGANSPYCSPSAFAGNYLFINPKGLFDINLVSEEDYKSNIYTGTPYTADYEFAAEKRLELLKKAFLNINDDIAKEIKEFEINNSWLTDYSVFMAVKEQENMKPWWEWSDKHAHYFECIKDIYSYEESAAFWKFVQYIFYRQWNEIKSYANKKGIAVIGDMPIYVAMDSADTWAHPELFQLDEENVPTAVAGCPPDGFSATGQLWGNPLYRWDYHRNTGYQWWISRLSYVFRLYDVVRIDHFRGFDEYFSIPYGAENAIGGHWEKGPGIDLFRKVEQALGWKQVIAEDLGYVTDSVRQLVHDSGFPGMKVLEFAFDSRDSGCANDYLPHNYPENSVAYTGTHDNETIAGWWKSITVKERKLARDYLCDNWTPDKDLYKCFISLVMRSSAKLCVIPMQDYMGLDNSCRMNQPSTVGKNWKWRIRRRELTAKLQKEIHGIALRYGRMNWSD